MSCQLLVPIPTETWQVHKNNDKKQKKAPVVIFLAPFLTLKKVAETWQVLGSFKKNCKPSKLVLEILEVKASQFWGAWRGPEM
jgi:hypothetical protein